MSKITLTPLVNLTNQTTAVNAINANNATLVAAVDNTLSRDGTAPNQMLSTLDMNSNRIVNLPLPLAQGEPIRLADLTTFTQFQNSVNLTAALAAATASANSSAASATTSGNSATASASSATASGNSATAAAASAAAAAASVGTSVSAFNYIPAGQIAAIQNGTSSYDIGPVINAALTTLNGQALYFPPGTYYVNTPIVYKATGGSLKNGAKIIGAGSGATTFLNTVAGIQLTSCFSTTNGSVIVTMAWPSHTKIVGDIITLTNLGSHNYGGLDMDGVWMITQTTANTVSFNHYNAATSSIATTGSVTICAYCISLISNSQFSSTFAQGSEIRGIKISQYGFPIGNSAVRVYSTFQTYIDDLWINGAVCDGLSVPVCQGDVDSTSQLVINRLRVNDCGRWGMDLSGYGTTVAGAQTSVSELSNTYLGSILCDSCGTLGVSFQYSGALKWRGQGIHLANVAITTAKCVGIYIPGGQATSEGFTFNEITLENSVGIQFQVEALDGMVGSILEMRNNNTYLATIGFSIAATTNTVRNIVIQQGLIRAFSGNNPYVAYNATGANYSNIRIYTPLFKVFGTAGQTQVAGFAFT